MKSFTKKTIKKTIIFLMLCLPLVVQAQENLSGSVRSLTTGTPLQGVSVKSLTSGNTAITDGQGVFDLATATDHDTVEFSLLGRRTKMVILSTSTEQDTVWYLEEHSTVLDEVKVSTGYYEVNRERATGSFVKIDNTLLNRSVGMNVIDRLEGVANGLAFNRSPLLSEGDHSPSLRIRGVGTIKSDSEPLIVLDNFPYEGDVNSINPEDIESITVLKDAAAASIWGARAGNGVIVISSKKGARNQRTKVGFSSSLMLRNQPDLHYNKNFLPSEQVLEVERFLFDKGHYAENDWTILSPAVELFIKHRDMILDDNALELGLERMAEQDIRTEALDNLYRKAVLNQYAVNFRGGTENMDYYFSTGYDRNLGNRIGDEYNRFTINSSSNYTLFKRATINAGVYYSRSHVANNGLGITDLLPASGAVGTFPYPYTKLADEFGNPLPVNRKNRMLYNDKAIDNGLLDWYYRPIDEMKLADNSSKSEDIRLNAGLNVDLVAGLSFDLKYQYQQGQSEGRTYHHEDSYFTRDLVNQFTQTDLERIIPHGAILEGSNGKRRSHYGRVQLNYNANLNEVHRVDAIAGSEIRENLSTANPGYRVYDYDNGIMIGSTRFNYNQRYNARPRGTLYVPPPPSNFSGLTDRFVSYYGNAAYSYDNRYTLTVSSRWDASNLFGVKTNQKGVPLWSIGGGWNIMNEQFSLPDEISNLRLRATYGYNGNINPLHSAFPIISFASDSYTNLPIGIIQSTGNPELRWEKIGIFNLALDYGVFDNRIKGSIEYFVKKGMDLIGENFMAPTTGIYNTGARYNMNNFINYASMTTKGFDLELNTVNIDKSFKWETNMLVNIVSNKITDYMADQNPNIKNFFSVNSAPVIVGNSRDAIYTLPWNGLDPNTGDPLAIKDGEEYSNYTAYLNAFSETDLINGGVTIPPYYGSLRNTFNWKGFSFSANLTWAVGHKFRRSTIVYETLFNTSRGHSDFMDRWQKPGDERSTNIPSMPDALVANRDFIYYSSETMLEKGDYIRLQDLNFSYSMKNLKEGFFAENIRLFFYARDLGLIWRANKYKIDPAYAYADYPPVASFSIGLQASF